MGFKSFLSAVGHDTLAVLKFIASPQGQAAEAGAGAIVTAINPAAGAALFGIEALVNRVLKQVLNVEALAANASQGAVTGEQKAAAVIAQVTPNVKDMLISVGVPNPTADQIQAVSQAISNGLVQILNAIPAPPTA